MKRQLSRGRQCFGLRRDAVDQCIFQKKKRVYVTGSPPSLLSGIRSNLAMKFFDIITRIAKIRID